MHKMTESYQDRLPEGEVLVPNICSLSMRSRQLASGTYPPVLEFRDPASAAHSERVEGRIGGLIPGLRAFVWLWAS